MKSVGGPLSPDREFPMPPLPPWEGMHVLVVHYPIALLTIAPVFVLIGAFSGLRSMMVSALILMVLGTIGAFVATNTGEAAMDVMEDFEIEDPDKYDLAYEVLEEHEEQGEYARNLFTGGTVLYALVFAATLLFKKCGEFLPRVAMHLVFLGLWAYPMIVLANAAHEGGRLVHEFGAKSVLAETAEVEEVEVEEVEEEDAGENEDDPAGEEAA